MKGLVIKDIRVLKNSVKSITVIVIVFALIGIFSDQMFMTCFSSVYASVLPMTCMAYDERSHFNRFAKVLPVQTKDIVLSKYATGLIIAAIAAVISFAISFAAGERDFISVIAVSILMPIMYQSVMMPIMFKFGTEKSRLIIMASFAAPGIIIMLLAQLGLIDRAERFFANLSFGYIFVILIPLAIYVLSVLLSLAICKNKELQ